VDILWKQMIYGKLKKCRAFFGVGFVDADGNRLLRSILNLRMRRPCGNAIGQIFHYSNIIIRVTFLHFNAL